MSSRNGAAGQVVVTGGGGRGSAGLPLSLVLQQPWAWWGHGEGVPAQRVRDGVPVPVSGG